MKKIKDLTNFFESGGTLEEMEKMIKSSEIVSIGNGSEQSKNIENNPSKLENINLTDSGNAEFFVFLYSRIVRFDHTLKIWFLWGGHYWIKNTKNEIFQLALNAARRRQALALSVSDVTQKERILKWALQSENKNRLTAMLHIAKTMNPIATVRVDWNTNAWLLQFENGTVDIRTLQFTPGKPDWLIDQCVGYLFDVEAQCPKWQQFLMEIMDGDVELVEFLQRSIGYSLTGETTEQCLFLLHGKGANGKTVFLDVIRSLLNEYAVHSPFSAIEFQRRQQNSNDLARLQSKRLVTTSESGATKKLNEERIKAITGGDPITARYLFREFFTFQPKFKLWCAFNSLPNIDDNSHGFWRRIRLIPFVKKFEGVDDNRQLKNELLEELPGILNWALEGSQIWLKKGLDPPEVVLNATKKYKFESDVVFEFIDEYTISGDGYTVGAKKLYDAFLEWHLNEHSGIPCSQTDFGRRLTAMGYKKSRGGPRRLTRYLKLGLVDFDH